MNQLDLYSAYVSGGYGAYGLVYICGDLRQLGEPSETNQAVLKRFNAADGSIVQYPGYVERKMTLALECERTQVQNIMNQVNAGAFVLSNIIRTATPNTRGTLCYLDSSVSVKRVSRRDGLYQVTLPVLFGATNLAVPIIGLCTSDFLGGFEFGGEAVFLKDCTVQKDGSYRLKTPLYFKPETMSTYLHIEADIGSGVFPAETENISILLQINGFRTSLNEDEIEAAKGAPGHSLDIPPGDLECSIEIRATWAKPLEVHFSVVRLGS